MSTPLSDWALNRLRVASRWARFVAIFGFFAAGLMVLGLVWLMVGFESIRLALRLTYLIGGLILAAPMIVASALAIGYGNHVARAFREGAPALERAMSSLLSYFRLQTVLAILATAVSLYSTLVVLRGW